ncbi:MAG: galactitol-1-phosphate 5-dehydrogenase [Spirochaetes bacterium]|nr:MAG: galactitol-1-phosphate 5-dehydrogenase [Spirochaetota bacterium]RKX94656.1 MAG: galactitol-1-phosphate 5-dehydrogenase [Spirochaetota bacterium]
MKALTLIANGQLEVLNSSSPEPLTPDSSLVRIRAAGVCGSDIPRGFQSGAYQYPLVMGHELSGIVEEPAPGSAYSAGDLVAIFPLLPDMSESINQIGEYALSKNYDYFGSRRDGGFQEYLSVPEFNLIPVPQGVDPAHASMTEPCAVAYHAVDKPDISPGMSAAVIGGGPIGNMAAQWLRIRGCRPVIVSEPDEQKRDIAENMGFSVIDPITKNPVEVIQELTGGGADVVVEACGLPLTFRQALGSTGLFGQVVFMGNIHGDFTLSEPEFSAMLRREITIHTTWNSKVAPRGRDEWTRVLAAMQNELDLEPLISHRIGLDEGPELLESMFKRTLWYNKVIFTDDK